MRFYPVALTFLGTRGEIKARTRRHRRHSALLVQCGITRIMIDCGADWLDQLRWVEPSAIVLTHAHPDHAAGLARGAPCPVYATKSTYNVIHSYPIRDWRRLPLRKLVTIGGVRLEAIPVEHSVRAPAVGYRVSVQGSRSFFYVPDVAVLPNAAAILQPISVYIGDGATVRRSMVRKKGHARIGHASVVVQLAWCEQAGVRRAVFTHCGSRVVRGNARELDAELKRLGREYGVEACFACDGDKLVLADGCQPWRARHDARRRITAAP